MADILLAAELENEMDAMAEGGDGDEDVYADDGDEEEVGEEGQVMDRSHLVGKPKRKRELKAGLLRFLIKKKLSKPQTLSEWSIENLSRELLFNKPKRHTFSGLYMWFKHLQYMWSKYLQLTLH